EFLQTVTHAWPAWLEENGVMNPAARQVALLNAQARAWEECAPDQPVVIAGTTAGIPAVARLARVVARLPLGCVVLPVLDTLMSDADWAAMEDSHPQAGLANLLAGLDATRDDVRMWGPEVLAAPQRHDPEAYLLHDSAGSPRRGPVGPGHPMQRRAVPGPPDEPGDDGLPAWDNRAQAGEDAPRTSRFALLSRELLPA